MPLLGLNSHIGFREISSTGHVATTAAEFMYVDSFSFSRTRERELINEVGVGNRVPHRQVVKNVSAEGSFVRSVDPNNGIALYQYLLGGSITTASNSSLTFTHTFGEDDDVPSGTRLQFEVSLGGDSSTTYRFYNGVVESYSLAVSPGEIAKETFGMKFSDHGDAANTVSTVALTRTDPITGNNVCVSLGTSITAVSQVAIKDFTLNISNAIGENRELCTSTIKDMLLDTKTVSGSFNATFSNNTLYSNFLNNTASAMQIVMTSNDVTSNTNHEIKINLPRIFYDGDTPPVEGTGEIVQPITFQAIVDSGTNYQVQVVVTNADSSVSK